MPITTSRDQVRLKIGDTDADDPLLYDDEIDACVEANTVTDPSDGTVSVNIDQAGADAADAIAAKFARGFTFSTDGQSFNRSERVNHYRTVAQALRARGDGYSVPITSTVSDLG